MKFSCMIPRKSEADSHSSALRCPPLPPSFSPKVLYCQQGVLIVDKPYDVRVDGKFEVTLEKMVREGGGGGKEGEESEEKGEGGRRGMEEGRRRKEGEDSPLLPLPMDRFRLINQLDFSTSGAIVLGLNKSADSFGSSLFQERKAEKWYLAVGEGHCGETRPVWNKKRILEQDNEFRMLVEEGGEVWAVGEGGEKRELRRRGGGEEGKEKEGKWMEASTVIVPLLTCYLNSKFLKGREEEIPVTLFALRLFSGRRHQLRLHLKSIGHPIIGDATYHTRRIEEMGRKRTKMEREGGEGGRGEGGKGEEEVEFPRMMLHAWRLLLPFSRVGELKSKKLKKLLRTDPECPTEDVYVECSPFESRSENEEVGASYGPCWADLLTLEKNSTSGMVYKKFKEKVEERIPPSAFFDALLR